MAEILIDPPKGPVSAMMSTMPQTPQEWRNVMHKAITYIVTLLLGGYIATERSNATYSAKLEQIQATTAELRLDIRDLQGRQESVARLETLTEQILERMRRVENQLR